MKIKSQARALNFEGKQILQMLYPFTKRGLADMVLRHIQQASTLDNFHSEIVSTYFPLRIYGRIVNQLLFRSQSPGETLAEFIEDIRLHADILRVQYTEAQIVSIIGSGATMPEFRAQFCSLSPPTTYDQLRLLCSRVNDLVSVDVMQNPSRPTFSSNTRVSHNFSGASFSRREPIICNFCGISGHTSSVCRKRLRSNPSRNVNFRQNYDRTTNQQNRTNSD